MNQGARLLRIIQLARDPRVRIEELEQCIAGEPRLAAEVVRIADSGVYGMEGRIHSLTRALLFLGAPDVGAIAAMSLVRPELCGAGDELWIHSLEIAVGSQLVSRRLDLGMESEAFLTGLLHELREPPPGCTRPLAALLGAAHAILADVRADALADLDLHPDDEAAVRAGVAERVKRLCEIL